MVFDAVSRTDPFRTMKFQVQIPGLGIRNMGFSKISGIQQESEVVEYREGNESLVMRKQPGLISQPEITFERGLIKDLDLRTLLIWREASSTFLGNTADGVGLNLYKQTVTIGIMNRAGAVSYEITLNNAWPMRIEYGDLDAATSEVLVARFVLVHEGLNLGDLPLGEISTLLGAALGA
jgi:phage tail-like protein